MADLNLDQDAVCETHIVMRGNEYPLVRTGDQTNYIYAQMMKQHPVSIHDDDGRTELIINSRHIEFVRVVRMDSSHKKA